VLASDRKLLPEVIHDYLLYSDCLVYSSLLSVLCCRRYYKIFSEAQKGFKLASADAVHGSLLTLGELLKNSGGAFVCCFCIGLCSRSLVPVVC
jgi:hypothetical protein